MPVLKQEKMDTLEDEERGEESDADEEAIIQVEATSHDSSFISDHDKGIEKAHNEIFPNHHLMACTQHIAANVETKFGKTPAKQVMSIGITFSTRQEDYLFDIVKKASTGAEQYLQNIDGKLWRSSYLL